VSPIVDRPDLNRERDGGEHHGDNSYEQARRGTPDDLPLPLVDRLMTAARGVTHQPKARRVGGTARRPRRTDHRRLEADLPDPRRHRRHYPPDRDRDGIRQARYTGLGKVDLEHAFAATAVNLIRLNAW
jgi:hypothetical protein